MNKETLLKQKRQPNIIKGETDKIQTENDNQTLLKMKSTKKYY